MAILCLASIATLIPACQVKEDPEAARARLQKLKDSGRIDEVSDTNFVYCAFMCDMEAVRAYLAAGTDVNARNRYGRTALIAAACSDPSGVWYEKNVEMVKLLIAKGADVNARDNEGLTPIAAADRCNRPDIATIIREAGGQ
ncbi:MAG: ankyrin repeat domain-containing protein [Acidobacteriota bacterium]